MDSEAKMQDLLTSFAWP